jgi:hypothetical protein
MNTLDTHTELPLLDQYHIACGQRDAFKLAYEKSAHQADRAIDELQVLRPRIRELELCLHSLVGLGRKDTSNPKYDGYYDTAQQLLNSNFCGRHNDDSK